jgi:hypothetical protein
MADKITKQELKEPDRFQVLAARAMQYLVRYKKEAIIAAGVVVVVIAAVAGWYFYDLSQEKAAMSLYNKGRLRQRSIHTPWAAYTGGPSRFIRTDQALQRKGGRGICRVPRGIPAPWTGKVR